MTQVAEKYSSSGNKVTIICDFSPPRGVDLTNLEAARNLDSDFICTAYNPGKSIRIDSASAAYWIKEHTGKNTIFTIATRDMNRIAIQSNLLGAQLLGLDNVVVVMGDPIAGQELTPAKDSINLTTTGLINTISDMNLGFDFRGRKLSAPTNFCIGATIDLTKNLEKESRLTQKKVEAGAQFFITQPIYNTSEAQEFEHTYLRLTNTHITIPIFYGLQVPAKEGVFFGNIPTSLQQELEQGRDGTDIALQLLEEFTDSGIKAIYLVPPILRGGTRDYLAAQHVLQQFKGRT